MEHLREQWRKTSSSGTYWRVHSKSRPFALSDAFSVPMSSFGDRDKTNRQARPGFSCMANPWHLWVYCMAMGWLADGYVQGSDVIEFSGRPITKSDFTDLGVPESAIEWLWDGGRGVDREPLVMPDMRTVNKQSWSSFEKMLLSTPLPSGPQSSDVRFNGDLDSWSDLAEILHERKGRYAKESGPVIDFLIGKFILGGIGRTASMKDRAYRGVPLKLDAGQGVPILQALVKGQRNVAARLIIDAMAMRAMDKAHWWAIGDQPNDEAGRWWTSSKEAAYQYSLGQYSENWMTMPVVMTAEFAEANDSAREDGQGAWWWHLPAGHPLTIVKFEAALPDDPQALLDGWNGISSPGNFDHPIGVDGDFVDLPIPPMRTTARIH